MKRFIAVSVALTVTLVFAMAASAHASTGYEWTMSDLSGLDTSGTIQLSPYSNGVSNPSAYSESTDAQSWVFTGIGVGATASDVPALNPGASDFSVSATIKLDSNWQAELASQGDFDVVRKGLSENGQYYKIEVILNAAGTAPIPFCKVKGSVAADSVRVAHALNDGNFHTITCTKTSTGLSLTEDAYSNSNVKTIGSITNTAQFAVGGKAEPNQTSQDYFSGSIDDVKVTI